MTAIPQGKLMEIQIGEAPGAIASFAEAHNLYEQIMDYDEEILSLEAKRRESANMLKKFVNRSTTNLEDMLAIAEGREQGRTRAATPEQEAEMVAQKEEADHHRV